MGIWRKKTGTNHLLESQVAFQTACQQLVGHWSVHNTFQWHSHHTEVKFEMLSLPWSSPIQIKRPWMPFLSGKEKEMCSWPICSWSKVPSCNWDGEEPLTFCWPHLIWNWVAAMRLIDLTHLVQEKTFSADWSICREYFLYASDLMADNSLSCDLSSSRYKKGKENPELVNSYWNKTKMG